MDVGRRAALAVLALVLSGCGAGAPTVPTRAAVDTDAVQADPPVTAPAVVVTSATYSPASGAMSVTAFVQGLFESDGNCVLTAARSGAESVVGTRSLALPASATTDCGVMTLPMPSEASGTWAVTVDYLSPDSELSSGPVDVVVP